ncbi:hypothetical protein F2Q69_00052501 [Brassica cretica]|uniref:Uncharacterized protein n=1 Tax=Brassica cretica TaxID=69181 RepID=A0A8S9MXM3_BRACR|nr:hypothetical protein F2Q69_00052501 [Brassica cretica]
MLGGDVMSWFPLVSQLLIVFNSGTEFPSIRGLRGQKARYLREIEEVKFCLLQANECLLALVQVKPEVVSWSPRIIVLHNFLSSEVKPEVVSWSPRIIVLHNFLSSEECEYLKAIARPHLQVSTVVDIKTGKGVKSYVRTSSGILDLYNTRADLRKKVHLAIDKYALHGLRSLAVARQTVINLLFPVRLDLSSVWDQTCIHTISFSTWIRKPSERVIGVDTIEIHEVKFCLLQANECLLALVQVKPEVVIWSPRIIVLHNFLSSEVSTVVDIKTGKGVKSDVRTNSGVMETGTE